ncbi:MAG: hypothetical protein RLO52_19965 [Sandaracinaceae bacterium]
MRTCLSALPLLVALSACSPPQCSEAQPLMDSTAQAIAARDYEQAETDARALAAALEGADGELGMLEARSTELADALHAASQPAASPEAGARSAAEMSGAIERFDSALASGRAACD